MRRLRVNIGNRKTAQKIAEEISYDANNINQYSSITRNETAFVPTFDTDGNQTLVQSSTGIWIVVYNADNRPVSFTKTEGDQTTLIECVYDYMGRRSMKKISVNGTATLHHRYIYRGYLQIACVDLTRNGHPALWLTMWDPGEPVATRPLAIQKNATWYTYGHDLTKNGTELYKTDGTIATTYDYTPYGAVTAKGIDQPFQWSSEVFDAELGMVYYNYRHYNPMDGKWIGRDPLGENGLIDNFDDYENIDFTQITNLYAFGPNDPINGYDVIAEAWGGVLRFVWNLLRATGRKAPKPPTPKPPTPKPPTPKPPTPKPKPKQEPKTKPKKDFGDCTSAEHAALNMAVGAACKGPAFSCDKQKNPNLSCDEIKIRIANAAACLAAREAINKKCFKGGDKTHKAEEENARTALKKCTDRLAECINQSH